LLEHALIVYKTEIADKNTPTVVSLCWMGYAVHAKMAVKDHGAV
jgi:hypothetical protein